MSSKTAVFLILYSALWIGLILGKSMVGLAEKQNNQKLETLISTNDQVLGTASKSADCVVNGALPDHECTPGAVFPDATLSQICVSGYSKTVRNVSASLKKEVYAEYNISYPVTTGSYEVDHLIPLAIGGSNDISNLWPEAANPTPGFKEKDLVEVYLKEEVCSGAIDLKSAQVQVANNWLPIYNNLTPAKIKELKSKYKNWTN